MEPFLPADYERPVVTGSYAKLKEGQNKFRVLSTAITGFEGWSVDKKPVRFKKYPDTMPNNLREAKLKFFWAFVVWSYNEKKVQILELTQVTIQDALESLLQNEDWGNLDGYDITIRREGEGLETSYTVQPSPHKELDPAITQQYEEMDDIHLEALYEGADPFNYQK